MKRASKLQIAEYCGFGGTAETPGDSMAAIEGRVFHSMLRAGYRPSAKTTSIAFEDMFELTDDDAKIRVADAVKALVDTWLPPDAAEFEVPIALDAAGRLVDFNAESVMVRGTADCTWFAPDVSPEDAKEMDSADGIESGRCRAILSAMSGGDAPPARLDVGTLYVVDFKSGPGAEWTVPPPADNLQTAAYGFGLAERAAAMGKVVTGMRLGIYLVAAKRFVWANYPMGAPQTAALWERVKRAGLKDPEKMTVGSHCLSCYARRMCPAYLIPAQAAKEVFWPMTVGPEVEVSDADVVRMLVAARAAEDMADFAKKWAQNFVTTRGRGVVDPERGMTWQGWPTAPRESVSISSLKNAGIYEAAKQAGAVKTGDPGVTFSWRRRKGE